NNSGGWQWVAGCGADASPWFRIFNPMLQGKKFDGDGEYVRRWLPELAGLSDRDLQIPWEAPPLVLADAGVTLGSDYPFPIVDHKDARAAALDAYDAVSKASS
ncbi:MAG: deoxyribodipyrimidine photo-lyase, partial [Halieaceae bacterium]|nr:deoxyribodipyrimidine photo-lyase [Halieaceae bacterium]